MPAASLSSFFQGFKLTWSFVLTRWQPMHAQRFLVYEAGTSAAFDEAIGGREREKEKENSFFFPFLRERVFSGPPLHFFFSSSSKKIVLHSLLLQIVNKEKRAKNRFQGGWGKNVVVVSF